MTIEEFSNEFDLLLNSESFLQEFGTDMAPTSLNEYEKSLFLTRSQEEIVKGLYSGSLGGVSFEEIESLRRYLDPLVKTAKPEVMNTNPVDSLSNHSTFYKLPEDLWYITYESADIENPYCQDNPSVQVVPMRQDEWNKVRINPFRKPNKRRVIRLDSGKGTVELVSSSNIGNYLIRYISRPSPIILVPLSEDNLSIGGLTEVTECKLPDSIHRYILDRAVKIALMSKTSLNNNNTSK